MKKMIALTMLLAGVSYGQVMPEGTKVRLRLEQALSSATARTGQPVQFTVVEDVIVDDAVVIAQGSTAMGTVTEAESKRRMGRAGKLDFSIERVRTVDGKNVNLRSSSNRQNGKGSGVKTGLVMAGIALVSLPAAPLALLIKGKDVDVPRGMTLEAFTDNNYVMAARKTPAPTPAPVPDPAPVQTESAAPAAAVPAASNPAGGNSELTVNSSNTESEVLIDGKFVGNAPSKVKVASGVHMIQVKSSSGTWERQVEISEGSSITINAPSQTRLATYRQ